MQRDELGGRHIFSEVGQWQELLPGQRRQTGAMADCFKINYDLVNMINCKGEKLRYETFGGSCFSHSGISSDRLDCMALWQQGKDIHSKN